MIKTYPSAELLFNEAIAMDLQPKWETAHGLFSFQKDGKDFYVFYTKLHLNSQLGAWMTHDKYLTHIMLEKNGLPHLPFCYASSHEEVEAFLDEHKSVIQKPVLGQRSENVTLIKNADAITQGSLEEWIFEKYTQGTEYRYLVLQGTVIGVLEKTLTPTPGSPWTKTYRTLTENDWGKEMTSLAIKIAELFQMGLLAVDFIVDENNAASVLELNSTPGIAAFLDPDKGERVNVARDILSAVIKHSLQ